MDKNAHTEFSAGERLYLGETDMDVSSHLDRYHTALRFLKKTDRVLDAACGSGYGTEILSQHVAWATGVDVSTHAIEWGNEHHKKENVNFIVADLDGVLPFSDASFDAVISFESLEHVGNQEVMLKEFRRILKPGGILLISSPDREIITDKAHAENEYHINELNKPEFIEKISSYFEIEELYAQTRYVPLSWKQKTVKSVAKVDVFHWRTKIVKKLGLTHRVDRALTPFKSHDIEKVTIEEPNEFFVMIAIARKSQK